MIMLIFIMIILKIMKKIITKNSNFGKTKLLDIICGMTQRSNLRRLLLILYLNELFFVSQMLKPIMFADDTNLCCSNKEIKP